MPQLGVESDFGNVIEVAKTKIWNGIPIVGQEKFGMWHILFFAWFCNLAMHVGLSDMALFRYAKRAAYGLYSAFGMYPGHMLAWVCSGVMVAANNRIMDPGQMAYKAAGLAGAVVTAAFTGVSARGMVLVSPATNCTVTTFS